MYSQEQPVYAIKLISRIKCENLTRSESLTRALFFLKGGLMFLVIMVFTMPNIKPELCVLTETKEKAQEYIDKQLEGRQYNGFGVYTIKEIPIYK
jgi:hypothetical protein